jgi:hypothetical protein
MRKSVVSRTALPLWNDLERLAVTAVTGIENAQIVPERQSAHRSG